MVCFLVPAIYGSVVYGSWSIGLFVFGFLRWLITMHATWTVNSLAHMRGKRPFSESTTAVESPLVSVLAVGEGWHNYHHAHPMDYRACDAHWWVKWNPTLLVIDFLALIGQVTNRKTSKESAHTGSLT